MSVMPRLIARLDIKGEHLIKGVHLEGLRKLGKPELFAQQYNDDGADELLYLDLVASLYQRDSLVNLLQKTAGKVFCPLTVGGGLRTLEDIENVLKHGADKVVVNTAAHVKPTFIKEAADRFGRQCIVVSIEARKIGKDHYECMTESGRNHTHREVRGWAQLAQERGAGEILLTSIDREGTGEGLDPDLIHRVADGLEIPVVASGGAGNPVHVVEALQAGASGVACAQILHYQKYSLPELRRAMQTAGFSIRETLSVGG